MNIVKKTPTISDIISSIRSTAKDCRNEMDNVDIAAEAQDAGSGVYGCLDDIESYLQDLEAKIAGLKEAL